MPGEDLAMCGFCRKVYHDRPECLGEQVKMSDFEVGQDWLCPCCFTNGKNDYENVLPAHTIAMQQALGGTTMRPLEDFMFCIVSKGRPKNVPEMLLTCS